MNIVGAAGMRDSLNSSASAHNYTQDYLEHATGHIEVQDLVDAAGDPKDIADTLDEASLAGADSASPELAKHEEAVLDTYE